jgi:uncharacterized protein (TIGR03437 family)
VNVLTANYGNQRLSANLSETTLTPKSLTPSGFGKLGAFPVDGQIFAQPLYVSGVSIPGVGTRNIVYVVTMHESVYAIDADNPTSTTPLWHVSLGTSVLASVANYPDFTFEAGILGTPVIDTVRGVMYLVAETYENSNVVFRLHALSLTTGQESLQGPTIIQATVPGTGTESTNGQVIFDPNQHLQRTGLLLLNGVVYIGFGSHGDDSPYHGWIMAYDAGNIQSQLYLFNSTPNTDGGGIWQSGRGLMADTQGNIYVVVGNGSYDGVTEFGESFVKLSPQLKVLDWYTPENWQTLSLSDYDLGSTGATYVPGVNLIITGNKYGTIYVADPESMGHLATVTDSPQNLQAVRWGGIFTYALFPATSGSIVYVLEQGSVLRAFQMSNGVFETTPFAETTTTFDMPQPYDGIAISSNGGDPSTGVIWMTAGDYSEAPVPASLHAFDPMTLQELWNSDTVPSRDYLGLFAKFAVPTVANGKVFVPTFSNQLAIYGLLPATASAAVPSPLLSSVVNAASYASGTVSPGELVTIFGQEMGPPSLIQGVFDGSNSLFHYLSGVQVFFNDVSSPLVYVWDKQVSAIVPYAVQGPSVQVSILGGSEWSNQLTVNLAKTTPGIFSVDGSGMGQVVAANQDGSLNSSSAPALKGSVITLYATGAGALNPVPMDGSLTTGTPALTALPMTAQIDGQDAPVQYAGAAPGIVSGVVQVNIAVPAGVRTGPADSIVLTIGGQTSQAGATVAVQ